MTMISIILLDLKPELMISFSIAKVKSRLAVGLRQEESLLFELSKDFTGININVNYLLILNSIYKKILLQIHIEFSVDY